MAQRLVLLTLAVAAVAAACGGSPSGPAPCNAVEEQHPIEGFAHAAVCSHLSYATRPPSSGNHYPVWAAYRSYANPIPEGYWVHDLEHGAVVISYHCADCQSQLTAAQALIDSQPGDPLCAGGGPKARIVLTPDPLLDKPFAASAWGWTLRADCFDAAVFSGFLQRHYGQGREATCADGADLTSGVPAGCGQ